MANKKVFTDESLAALVDETKSYVNSAVSTKANSSHNHAASNITSGTLSSDRLPTVPIAKGGTGATTAAAALTNLGITATASELNKLDGVTATTAELNYIDGVTSNIQTQLDGKASSSHTHSAATTSAAGFMSASDKSKLDGITASADSVSFSRSLTSGTKVGTITINGTGTDLYAPTNTDTHYTSKNVVGSTTATSNTSTALTNGNVYLNSVENGAVTSSHKISGSGATTVTTDTSGNIIISSTDNNTTYSAAGSSLGLVKSGGDVTISSGVITVNDDSHNHTIANVDNLQASLDAKQATITGAATTITGSNLTASRALVSNSNGKVAVSDVTSTELSYLDGVTSNIQTQLDALDAKVTSNEVPDYITTGARADSTVGDCATAEGKETTASASYSHAEGYGTVADGECSHAEGEETHAASHCSHAEGNLTTASREFSHAEGESTTASGVASHAEGGSTTASGDYSHAEGGSTTASADYSHAEGLYTTVTGDNTITAQTTTSTEPGMYGHAEGYGTVAYGVASHAEGNGTTASGKFSHAEGSETKASASYSHAEGWHTTASGDYSHAEGWYTTASVDSAHAEGSYTMATGNSAHAEGYGSKASGYFSHAGGYYTIAQNYQYVVGKYNAQTTAPTSATDTTAAAGLFIVGIGTSNSARSNGFRINPAGKVYGTGTFGTTGADYAEYFEWLDENPNNEDRRGRFVTLEGDKIRYATANDDYILGVVSADPSVAGDMYSEEWHNRYLQDVFGNKIVDVVEIEETINEDGEIIPAHTERRWVLNPDYDPDLKYTSREERPEWAAIGIVGKLVVVDDGTCQVNGYCYPNADGIATASQEKTNYRIMERLDDTHIRIFIR